METRVMREGSRTPYSRARGSLNPTDRPESARPEAPAIRRNFEKSRIFSTYCPLAASPPDPHMRYAQAPRGCASKPVRPVGADHPHFAQLRGYAMRTFDLRSEERRVGKECGGRRCA